MKPTLEQLKATAQAATLEMQQRLDEVTSKYPSKCNASELATYDRLEMALTKSRHAWRAYRAAKQVS